MKVYTKSKYWRINAITLNNNHDYLKHSVLLLRTEDMKCVWVSTTFVRSIAAIQAVYQP